MCLSLPHFRCFPIVKQNLTSFATDASTTSECSDKIFQKVVQKFQIVHRKMFSIVFVEQNIFHYNTWKNARKKLKSLHELINAMLEKFSFLVV